MSLGAPGGRLQRKPQHMIRAEVEWPPYAAPLESDRDLFLTLVEATGELVARRRLKFLHDYQQCGWHIERYSTTTGQRLYRVLVNQLLEFFGIDLRLAEDGEDRGRLVHVTGDTRDELVESVIAAGGGAVDERNHAISLFRRRDAGVPEKPSACVALAGILEPRRDLLEEHLFKKDEGALFQLANEFDVRHRKVDQKKHYDPVFLDWIFWWYLATIELTDRIIARQSEAVPS